MKQKSAVSQELYQIMLDKGYSERIMQKKELEHSNAVYNEYLNSRER